MDDDFKLIPAPPFLTARVRDQPFELEEQPADHFMAHVIAIAWRATDALDWDQDGPKLAGTSYLVSVPALGGPPTWKHGSELFNIVVDAPWRLT